MQFTLLIGSFARGTGGIGSDIDVLRIGHKRRVKRPVKLDYSLPISYVDYDLDSFKTLFDDGSLFLYHAFIEGQLLEGDITQWNSLKENFVVSDDFRDSIEEYLQVLTYIAEYPEYERSSVPYLSNIFKCLKNIGVFRMASTGRYDFEKVNALMAGCGLSDLDARILISANAVFERSMPTSSALMRQFEYSAMEWKKRLSHQISRMAHDI
jgi:predicted nucleotidyltransferase